RTLHLLRRAREFGLDYGVAIGDDPRVFAEAVREWSKGAGVNVILDLVGASYLEANLDALARRGRMLLVGTLGGSSGSLDFRQMLGKRLQLTGTVLRARSTEEKASAVRRFNAHVVPLLARGLVRPVLDAAFTLDEARAAYERLESNATFGKVVLVMSDKKSR
ncbi:MAG: zinc-binding dehydrogenase, partial [Rubrivivax sp.]|nr:zinc-binding dehydrogenase [Pyrinomonadaceae bacterium]